MLRIDRCRRQPSFLYDKQRLLPAVARTLGKVVAKYQPVMKPCKEHFSEYSLSMSQSAMAGMPKDETRNGSTRNTTPPSHLTANEQDDGQQGQQQSIWHSVEATQSRNNAMATIRVSVTTKVAARILRTLIADTP
jgi:hypothetical protein